MYSATGFSGYDLYSQWVDNLNSNYNKKLKNVKNNNTEGIIIEGEGTTNLYPKWSPDGSKIAFISNKDNDYFGQTDLFVYDFKMTEDVIKTKVNLNMHMFSFLQEGKKQVHFSDVTVAVNNEQSLLLKKGNCLWTELLEKESTYYCKLLFFSDKILKQFLEKHSIKK